MTTVNPRDHDDDELLSPTLQDAPTATVDPARRPWQLGSQVYIAFFGGVLPVTAIAYWNSQRLGLPRDRLRLILGIGALGFAAVAALTLLVQTTILPSNTIAGRNIRLSSRVVAVLIYLLFRRIQQPADRVYQLRTDGQYNSLWRTGLVAVFGFGVLQNALIAGLVYLWLNR